MPDCNICCSEIGKDEVVSCKTVSCSSSSVACVECYKKYLLSLQSSKNPQCIFGCGYVWSIYDTYHKMPYGWVKNEWKSYQKEMLFEREKAHLLELQNHVKYFIMLNFYKSVRKTCEEVFEMLPKGGMGVSSEWNDAYNEIKKFEFDDKYKLKRYRLNQNHWWIMKQTIDDKRNLFASSLASLNHCPQKLAFYDSHFSDLYSGFGYDVVIFKINELKGRCETIISTGAFPPPNRFAAVAALPPCPNQQSPPPQKKRVPIAPCQRASSTEKQCRGFVLIVNNDIRGDGKEDDEGECPICETKVCGKCLIEKSTSSQHNCVEEDVESVRLIRKTSKPCPSCFTSISRIEGCSQMWCVNCHTFFNYNTGEIDDGKYKHNPHYFEWILKNKPPTEGGNGNLNTRLARPGSFLSEIKRFEENEKNQKFGMLFSRMERFSGVFGEIVENFRQTNYYETTNNKRRRTLNFAYLLNKIGEKQWKSQAFSNERDLSFKVNLFEIFVFLVEATNDILSYLQGLYETESLCYEVIEESYERAKELSKLGKKYICQLHSLFGLTPNIFVDKYYGKITGFLSDFEVFNLCFNRSFLSLREDKTKIM